MSPYLYTGFLRNMRSDTFYTRYSLSPLSAFSDIIYFHHQIEANTFSIVSYMHNIHALDLKG